MRHPIYNDYKTAHPQLIGNGVTFPCGKCGKARPTAGRVKSRRWTWLCATCKLEAK